MKAKKIQNMFEQIGGKFMTDAEEIKERLQEIKAFVFDWDGVFNNGIKGGARSAGYSEADSMGLNLCRYSFWLKNNQQLPFMAIITGAQNPAALELTGREHFHGLYLKVRDKKEALSHFCEQNGLQFHQIAYSFDDVNDLALAAVCGLRFLVKRNTSPLLADYIQKNKLCDYQTSTEGGQHALREITELLMGLYDNFEEVCLSRTAYDPNYQHYWTARQGLKTRFYMPSAD